MPATQSEEKPGREQLVKAVEAAQKASKAHSTAAELKSTAKKLTDSKERNKLFQEAYEKEVEAHGYSKLARRMESGTWQGGGIGAGIGAGVGMGLGTVVGTVVGGVTAIPTTGLGLLVGAGTGAIHGPFIKIGGTETKFEDAKAEDVVDALEQNQTERRKRESDQGTQVVSENISLGTASVAKKKPRKLEVRSASQSRQPQNTNHERRKPRKIEVRSSHQRDDATNRSQSKLSTAFITSNSGARV